MSDGLMLPIDPPHVRAKATGSNAGVNVTSGHAGNAVADAAQAGTIAGGGITGSPQKIDAGSYNTIGGGYDDQITSTAVGACTIAGGAHHRIQDTVTHGTIGGGSFGTIKGGADYSTIGGGTANTIDDADGGTIAGGQQGLIRSTGGGGSILGGIGNAVAGLRAAILGGFANVAASNDAAVAGSQGAVKGGSAGIAGGFQNRIGPVRVFSDASVTASSVTVSVPSGDFSGGDVGATVYVQGCGTNFGVHVSTIAAVNSATSIDLADAPPNTRATQNLTLVGTGTAADYGSIGGGFKNLLTGLYARIGGGRQNQATNSYAVVGGGNANQATGASSTVGGGEANVAGANSWATVAGGTLNQATGVGATIPGGNNNLASGTYAFAEGLDNVASGDYSTTIGRDNDATGGHGHAQGYQAVAGANEFAIAAGAFATPGDAQVSRFVQKTTTTDALGHSLLPLASIPDDSTWTYEALVVARRTDADNESAGYRISGVIDRNAGTVALVGSPTVAVIAEDTAAWDVSAQADDSVNKALKIVFTGENAKTIRTVCLLTLVKVTG